MLVVPTVVTVVVVSGSRFSVGVGVGVGGGGPRVGVGLGLRPSQKDEGTVREVFARSLSEQLW